MDKLNSIAACEIHIETLASKVMAHVHLFFKLVLFREVKGLKERESRNKKSNYAPNSRLGQLPSQEFLIGFGSDFGCLICSNSSRIKE